MTRRRQPLFILALLVIAALLLVAQRRNDAAPWSLAVIENPSGSATLSLLARGDANTLRKVRDDVSEAVATASAIAYVRNADANGLGMLEWATADGGSPVSLAACADRRCAMPALDVRSERLAYVRVPVGRARGGQVMVQSGVRGEALPAFTGSEALVMPAWSGSSRFLAAYSPSTDELYVRDFASNEIVIVPAEGAEVFAWSPAMRDLLMFATSQRAGERLAHQIWLADMESGNVTAITGLEAHPITSATWRPDGGAIAFSQRRQDVSGTGRQLRVIAVSDGKVQNLTRSEQWTYGGPAWSPDGSTIFAVRNTSRNPPELPSVVQIDVASGIERVVLQNATQPRIVDTARP